MSAGGAIGFDIGCHNSVIATVKQKSIDVVLNELTNRSTPNVVAFGPKQRFLGEVAYSKLGMNFRNSFVAPSRYLGLSAEYLRNSEEPKWLTNKLAYTADDTPVFEATYRGDVHSYNAQSVAAMMLSHLKETVTRQGLRVTDVVIAVPSYYTDTERRAVLDAATIADVPCVGLMNDTTAAALSYGIYRGREITDESRKTVAFVDMGHSKISVAIAEFSSSKLQMLGKAFDRNLGSRDLDWNFAKYIAGNFEKKHGVDPFSNPKSKLKLLSAVERLRKVLSGGSDGNLHVEYLVEDIDLELTVTREEFLTVNAELIQRVKEVCLQAISNAGGVQVSSVEILGGASRIPSVQTMIAEAFRVESCSKTLNAEEEISKGCALQAAMLSPFFNVKPYAIVEITPYRISAVSKPISDIDIEPEIDQIFTEKNVFPISKIVSFTKRGPFTVDLVYDCDLPIGIPKKFATFSIFAEEAPEDFRVKLRFKMNASGVIALEAADKMEVYYEEVIRKEETKTEDVKAEEAKSEETGEAKSDEVKMDLEPPKPEYKKRTRKTQVANESLFLQLSPKTREDCKAAEVYFKKNDNLAKETLEKKNELESYVYQARDRLNGTYKKHMDESLIPPLIQILSTTENWLYEEGSDSTKEAYQSKLDSLKTSFEQVHSRYSHYEALPELITSLKSIAAQAVTEAMTQDAAKAHITEEERIKVLDLATANQKWIEEISSLLSTIDPRVDFPVSRAEFGRRENELLELTRTTMSRSAPPPPPPPPKEEEPKKEDAAGEEAKQEDKEPVDMDVE
jgi:heat shock protein 4